MSAKRVGAALLGAVIACAGCVSDDAQPAPMARPLAARTDIQVSEISLMAYSPIDVDSDGYRETLTIEAYLISPSVPEPVNVRGSFEFAIYDASGGLIHRWPIAADLAQQVVRTNRSLTVFRFVLTAPTPPPGKALPVPDTIAASFTPEAVGATVRTRASMPVVGQ